MTLKAFQPEAPPAGLDDATILPAWSTATHNDGAGQETPWRLKSVRFAAFHRDVAVAGLEDAMTVATSATTQSVVPEQEMEGSQASWSTRFALQAVGPPSGLVATSTLPPPSTAAQKVVVGHETSLREQGASWISPGAHPTGPSICVTFQAAAPPVGFADVTTLPPKVTPTQRLTDGHDTRLRPPAPDGWITLHDAAGPRGVVEVATLPVVSTTTQRSVLGHDAPERYCIPSCVRVQAFPPPLGSEVAMTCPLLSIATHIPFVEQPTVSSRLSADWPPVAVTFVTVQAWDPPVGLLEASTLPPV